MPVLVNRRQVLRWGVAGGAAMLIPAGFLGCGEDDSGTAPPGATPTATPVASFLTADEQQVVRAISGRIIPTDTLPGAIEAGAPNYINLILSVLPDENSAGMVFAGGPFSGRTPFPDPTTGTPSHNFPPDDFAQFLPLTRLQLLSWRVQLLGSDNVPGGDFNDAVLGKVIGWRDQYRTGIAAVQSASMTMFGSAFPALTPDQQDSVLAASALQQFVSLITGHVLEGMFSAPEYGGNTDGIGWKLIGYDGDSQPLGYSIFDTTTMTYNERPDKPNSTANPDEDCSGVDAETAKFLAFLTRLANPKEPFFVVTDASTLPCP